MKVAVKSEGFSPGRAYGLLSLTLKRYGFLS
jgi:hypothetical protein